MDDRLRTTHLHGLVKGEGYRTAPPIIWDLSLDSLGLLITGRNIMKLEQQGGYAPGYNIRNPALPVVPCEPWL